jgi:ATP-dependent helicase/nuclease subunit A
MNNSPLNAADPHRSAAVMASAGTGKTWLLVTRLIRLLLDGARPDGLLAVTFTRKAAAEMQLRLLQRLRELAECDSAALDQALARIGAPQDPTTRARAQRLYEDLLYSAAPLRITTFHAFCQELLRRFPLEADVPAGFEVLESSGILTEAAWDSLFAAATLEPDGALAQSLDILFERCGGLHNTRTALLEFLAHRSDWWAFCPDGVGALHFTTDYLNRAYDIDPAQDYAGQFLDTQTCADFQNFTALLDKHHTSTNAGHAAAIHQALTTDQPDPERIALLRTAMLRGDGEPRARKASGAQEKSLGSAGQTRFLELHEELCVRLMDLEDRLRRVANHALTQAWIAAGLRLLEHYQQLKLERRQLDFADLEWKAYCLLTQAGNAHWVQYKLDQRIDHLLVDEFQDTNPTQWRLLLPLLEEIAAGGSERARSLFLVGDAKQSIYRFRRADARLLEHAAHWLQQQSGADLYDLDKSRRSAPAIMACVNAVFGSGILQERLAHFHPHATYLDDSWGRVEILPPPAVPTEVAPQTGLRDPLRTPRPEPGDSAHDLEAQRIAARIQELIALGIGVPDEQGVRPLSYQDIIILLRRRTHAEAYERALRSAGIPYLGAARGALLESLEIRDLVALLNILIVPYDDLALAQVLRSPLFAAADDDLMQLAHDDGAWTDRLARLGPTLPPAAPLARAAHLLARWRELAGRLPVHDLLDRIYSEGNLPARYVAAFPAALRPRVRANLTRFIELALEVDSGRYPSLAHFLARVRELRASTEDAPDAAPPPGGARVRLMTIHAAKGLEAQVVILADTGPVRNRSKAYQALVDWPASAQGPRHFLLTGGKDTLDAFSRQRLAEQQLAEQREEANLLYVALTRAKRVLIVSSASEDQDSWYNLIKTPLSASAVTAADGALVLESGPLPAPAPVATSAAATAIVIDPRMRQGLAPVLEDAEIAPSHSAGESSAALIEEDGLLRGRAIHRFLELLCKSPRTMDTHTLRARVAEELGLNAEDADLQDWWTEAQAVVRDPRHRELFELAASDTAYNEIPIQYRVGERRVFGIIDRLVRRGNRVMVIDYKTHITATPAALPQLAEPYRAQLRLYAEGVRALWPDADIRTALLFTRCSLLYELE